jgi:hypothetical protein
MRLLSPVTVILTQAPKKTELHPKNEVPSLASDIKGEGATGHELIIRSLCGSFQIIFGRREQNIRCQPDFIVRIHVLKLNHAVLTNQKCGWRG